MLSYNTIAVDWGKRKSPHRAAVRTHSMLIAVLRVHPSDARLVGTVNHFTPAISSAPSPHNPQEQCVKGGDPFAGMRHTQEIRRTFDSNGSVVICANDAQADVTPSRRREPRSGVVLEV